jgi:hypothetical protein
MIGSEGAERLVAASGQCIRPRLGSQVRLEVSAGGLSQHQDNVSSLPSIVISMIEGDAMP